MVKKKTVVSSDEEIEDSTPKRKPPMAKPVIFSQNSKRKKVNQVIDETVEKEITKRRRKIPVSQSSDDNSKLYQLVEAAVSKAVQKVERNTLDTTMFAVINVIRLYLSHPEINGVDMAYFKEKASQSFDKVDTGAGVSMTHSVLLTVINDYMSKTDEPLTFGVTKALSAAVDSLLYDRYRNTSNKNKTRPQPVKEPSGISRKSHETVQEFRERISWTLHGGSLEKQRESLRSLVNALVANGSQDRSLLAFLLDEPAKYMGASRYYIDL